MSESYLNEQNDVQTKYVREEKKRFEIVTPRTRYNNEICLKRNGPVSVLTSIVVRAVIDKTDDFPCFFKNVLLAKSDRVRSLTPFRPPAYAFRTTAAPRQDRGETLKYRFPPTRRNNTPRRDPLSARGDTRAQRPSSRVACASTVTAAAVAAGDDASALAPRHAHTRRRRRRNIAVGGAMHRARRAFRPPPHPPHPSPCAHPSRRPPKVTQHFARCAGVRGSTRGPPPLHRPPPSSSSCLPASTSADRINTLAATTAERRPVAAAAAATTVAAPPPSRPRGVPGCSHVPPPSTLDHSKRHPPPATGRHCNAATASLPPARHPPRGPHRSSVVIFLRFSPASSSSSSFLLHFFSFFPT